ncbi:hypothetical protein Tco_0681557 [Tanacetum coccineum]|uniref:Uncharacterized protein n=1 Tax=Tanacetum coccineum TaxID=301880 RepID=A0ABQ4XQ04_9ASTR
MVETYSRGRQTTTPEPAWVIPTSHILDAVNNWANALCLPHNKARRELLYLKRLGISGPYELYSKRWERPKLTTNRFGWSSYEVIKAFYPDIVHLQFQMEDTQAAEITLRRADYQEYTIAEKDFKNLYPSDFEDLNLLLLQGYLFNLGYDNMRFWTAKDMTRTQVFTHAMNGRWEDQKDLSNLGMALLVVANKILDYIHSSDNLMRHVNSTFRSKCENKGIVPTEMELELEQTQQGSSHEVSAETVLIQSLDASAITKMIADKKIAVMDP